MTLLNTPDLTPLLTPLRCASIALLAVEAAQPHPPSRIQCFARDDLDIKLDHLPILEDHASAVRAARYYLGNLLNQSLSYVDRRVAVMFFTLFNRLVSRWDRALDAAVVYLTDQELRARWYKSERNAWLLDRNRQSGNH